MDNNNRTYYNHETAMRESRRNTALIVLALGIGAGVGAAAGLMFAPSSGQKIRDELTHGLEHSLEQGVSKGHEIVDPALKRMEKEVADVRQQLEDRVEEARKS